MTQLEIELEKLNKTVIEMLMLTKVQLEKAKEAILTIDLDLTKEILYNEARINSFELTIDRDCENIFALYTPVAVDLRFVLSILKINSSIERIGDLAKGIAKFVPKLQQPYEEEFLVATKFRDMFDTAIAMLNDISEAMVNNNSKMARTVFKKDDILDELNQKALKIITDYVKFKPESIHHALFLFNSFIKIERVGDYIKNIAEELIFHYEAKVLKHLRKKPELPFR